jgi:hypothetical protein
MVTSVPSALENPSRQWNGQQMVRTLATAEQKTLSSRGRGNTHADGPLKLGPKLVQTGRVERKQPRTTEISGHYFLFLGFSSSAALRRKM